jgi:hypothetical protein
MSLENEHVVDIEIGPTAHAQRTLLIVDGDEHADEVERTQKFVAKLKAYVAYILSEAFAAAHPGVEPQDVLIGVVCHQEPNEQMRSVTEVGPRGRPGAKIRVATDHCPSPSDMPWFVREGR